MPGDKRLEPSAEQRKEFGKHIRTLVLSWVALTILSVIIANVYWVIPSQYLCTFREDRRLMLLWPFNQIYIQQFEHMSYSYADTCWFMAVLSTSNAAWVCLVIVRILSQIARRDTWYRPWMLPKFAFISIALPWYFYFGISTHDNLRGPTSFKSISDNCSIILFMMGVCYLAITLTIDHLFLSLRRLYSKTVISSKNGQI